jgi:hypothetical protein
MDLEVNGIKPSLDLTTGRWSARVPVDEGEQITLQAVVIDRNGDEQSATVQVSNVALPPFFSEIDVSLDSQFLYAYGNETLSIHDLVSGSKQLVSDGLLELSKPGFEPMLSVEGMEVSEDGTRAILLRRGWGGGDALSIDLETGDQETIGELPNANHARDGYDFAYRYPDMSADFDSDELAFSYRADVYNDDANRCWLGLLDLGSGSIRYILQAYDFSYDYSEDTYVPAFCPDQVVLETANNRVIVAAENRELFGFLKSDFQGIYAYDLYDGQLNTLSDATVGQGPDLSKANYLLPMQTENKLLTLNSSAVIFVDLASGDRGLIIDDPDLPLQFNDAVLDESANRILIAEDVTVSALDLATGTREIVLNPGSSPSPAVGIGPNIHTNTVMLMDQANDRLLVIDRSLEQLLSINPDTLKRRRITMDSTVSENEITIETAELDKDGRWLYFTTDDRRLMRLNLTQGTVEIISADEVGTGPRLGVIRDICLDEIRGLVYLNGRFSTDEEPFLDGLLKVDIATGTRDYLLLESLESSPDILPSQLWTILYDTANDRLVSGSSGVIIGIDPGTGRWNTLAGEGVGEALPASIPRAWDVKPGHVLVGNTYSVDLRSGAWEYLHFVPGSFVVDRHRSLFYAHTNAPFLVNSTAKDRITAYNRDTGDSAVISRPEEANIE